MDRAWQVEEGKVGLEDMGAKDCLRHNAWWLHISALTMEAPRS